MSIWQGVALWGCILAFVVGFIALLGSKDKWVDRVGIALMALGAGAMVGVGIWISKG